MKQFSTLKTQKTNKKTQFFYFKFVLQQLAKMIFLPPKKGFGGKTHDISTLKTCSIRVKPENFAFFVDVNC